MACLFVLHRNEKSHMIKLKSIETITVLFNKCDC